MLTVKTTISLQNLADHGAITDEAHNGDLQSNLPLCVDNLDADGYGVDFVDLEESASVTSGKLVRFDAVEIREYGVILGDHPATSAGPPITIEWDHQAEHKVGLEEYEKFLEGKQRRSSQELRMSRYLREKLLLDQHSLSELRKGQKEVEQGKKHMQSKSPNAVDLAWESAVRKFKRWLNRKSGAAPDLAELWLQNYKQEQIKNKSCGMKRSTSDLDFCARRRHDDDHKNKADSALNEFKVSPSMKKLETIAEAETSMGMRRVQSAPLFY